MTIKYKKRNCIQHPLTVGLDVDDPRTTDIRRKIIRSKRFLRKVYIEWYELVRYHVPHGAGMILELGSGAGFMREHIPNLITSDVESHSWIDCVLPKDGSLPFKDKSLKAIVMTDVLHHICRPRSFFVEAARVVRPGGAMVMIEPWNTPWAKFIFQHFHYEPFQPETEKWEFPEKGPLSGANGALPWIVFMRDRLEFETNFQAWQILKIDPMMPFSYLLSGGVSLRALVPGFVYGACRWAERAIKRLTDDRAAMFALIVLKRP